tara:strand:- start:3283 stop:3483 length:201 start_codon:yes stop_codon:yes gene_type:complete
MLSIAGNNGEKYDIFKIKKIKKINRRTYAKMYIITEDEDTSDIENICDISYDHYDPYDYDTFADLD